MKKQKQQKVLSYEDYLRLYKKLRESGFTARTSTQDMFLTDTFEKWDESLDEMLWMARDILEANAPQMFIKLFPKDRVEENYSKASLQKFWNDITYYCEYVVRELKI